MMSGGTDRGRFNAMNNRFWRAVTRAE
jgi:hypothetical protein